jgi:probable selenium-dependent hydroxylase accessory protein YqeC
MLIDLFGLYKGCVVSIVGAGGKTSLMFALGEELRKEFKVLITTTTKIFMPSKEKYDYIYLLGEDDKTFRHGSDKGIHIIGDSCNDEGKLVGASCEEINKVIQYFDFTLIEADGSKRKPLKGWKENEPVICSGTSKTIGILNIKALGLSVNEDNIHRIDKFSNISGARNHEKVNIEHLAALIFHPEGLFKDSAGERILYINKVESEEDRQNLNKLMEVLRRQNKDYLKSVVAGSLLSGKGEGLVL